MALKNQPEFEAQDTTTAAPETKANAKVDAGVKASTAIAQASATSVGAAIGKMVIALSEQKDTLDLPTVSALARATPRVTAEQGSLYLDRKTDMGKAIKVEVVSWNHRWAIGTGTTDKEAGDHFRVSYDNKTIDGEPDVNVSDYLASLKAMGYDKAKVSPYGDLWGFVTWTEKKGDIPADERELTVIQMSQTSLGAFTSYCVSRGLLESRGAVKATTMIEIHAEAQESKGNRFTNLSFRAPK